MNKKFLNFFLIVITTLITLLLLEIFLIFKSYLIIDYDTEMWRYSKHLKEKSQNILINHVHQKNKKYVLQKIEISTNEIGLRGSNMDLRQWKRSANKILILGGSVTLGWGVEEKFTLAKILENSLLSNNVSAKVLNAGVGNYNTQRSINNFFENLETLRPNIIILQYFINDADILKSYKNDNEFLSFIKQNFHIGVYLFKFLSSFNEKYQYDNIDSYYEDVYLNKGGYKIVENEILRLSEYCKSKNIRCIITYTPDLRFIKHERLNFIRNKIRDTAIKNNYEFLDFTDTFYNANPKDFLNLYNDPHPNKSFNYIQSNILLNHLKL